MGVARSLFFKFFLMTDVVNRVSRDLDAASPDGNGLHRPRLRALAGVRFPDGSFSPDELTLLGGEKGPHFGQRVLVAANAMYLLADLIFQYNAERRALSEEFRVRGLVEMDGTTGHISIDPENYKELAPKIFEVEHLAKSLWDAAKRAKDEASATGAALGPKLKEALGDKRFTLQMGDTPSTTAAP
ncbi:MAG: hypothetical protein QM759_04955 [Terricaulis sp.]